MAKFPPTLTSKVFFNGKLALAPVLQKTFVLLEILELTTQSTESIFTLIIPILRY